MIYWPFDLAHAEAEADHIAFEEGDIEDSEVAMAADLAHHGEVAPAPDKTRNDVDGNNEMEEPSKLGRYVDRKKERMNISSPDVAIECCHRYDRVYAHRKRRRHSSEDKDNTLTRSDFVETVFFAMALRTDDYGVATTDFDLSESITKWERDFEDLVGNYEQLCSLLCC